MNKTARNGIKEQPHKVTIKAVSNTFPPNLVSVRLNINVPGANVSVARRSAARKWKMLVKKKLKKPMAAIVIAT